MPLTEEQKRRHVASYGLDPDKFTVDEYTPEQYAALNQPPVEAPKLTQGGAFMSRLKRAALPALAALPTIEMGAAAGSALGPIGSVVGGIAAPLLTGFAASKLQEPMFKYLQGDEGYKKGLETYSQAGEQYPRTSMVADQAPNLAALGPGGLMNAARGAGKLLSPVSRGMGTIAKDEAQALINTTVGAGFGAGGEAVKQYVGEEGKPFDASRIVEGGLLGGVMSQPYGPLGRKLFPSQFPRSTTALEATPPPDVISAETKAPNVAPKVEPPQTTPEQQVANIRNEITSLSPEEQAALRGEVKPSYADDKSEVVKSGVPEVLPNEEKGINGDPGRRLYQEQHDELGYSYDKQTDTLKQTLKNGNVLTFSEPKLTQLEQVLYDNQDKGLADLQKLTGKNEQVISKILNSALNKAKEIESIRTKKQTFYSEQSTLKTKPQPPATPEDRQQASTLAIKRGATYVDVPETISTKTGEPARGHYDPTTKEVALSDIATADTGTHEVAHKHLEDLFASADPRDVAFAERGVSAAGSKEKLAQATGERGVDVSNAPLKSWLKDFWSNVKLRTGYDSPEDNINIFARRTLDDRPYTESPELHSSSDISTVKAKLFSENAPTEDRRNSKDPSRKGILNITTPLYDKMIAKGGSDAIAGEAAKRFEVANTRYNGEITSPMVSAASKLKDKENSSRYIYESVIGGKPTVKLNPADKAIIDAIIHPVYKHVQDIQNREGLLVNGRQAKSNPLRRGPLMPSDKVIETLLEHPVNSVDRIAAEKQFIDFHVNQIKDADVAGAKEMLNEYLRGLSSIKRDSTPDFNALRKSEGTGIPWQWMEKDPVRLFQRYGSRASRDLAFFKEIQNIPNVRKVFGFKDQSGEMGDLTGIAPALGAEAATAKRRIAGEHTFNETLFNSFEHFARSLILGPVTGVKSTIGTLQQLLPYVEVRDLPKVAKAFQFLSRGLADGFEKGVIRHSITSQEVGSIGESVGTLADSLKSWGDMIRHWTGANKIEQLSRAHTMVLGEFLAEANVGRSLSGDISAVRFVNQFKPEGFNLRSTKLTPDIVKEMAANFTERVQGTYGGRGLPGFLLEPSSPGYWLLSLSKWGIEKSNIIQQDVFNPALKGDFGPLLRYTLGGFVTGEVISQLTQALYNKKSSSPSLVELNDKGKASDWLYKAFELQSLSGFAGALSDAAFAGAKTIKPYGKAQGATIPSVEIAKEVVTNVAQASEAIGNGVGPIDVTLQLANDILIQHIQALRVAYNQTAGRGDNTRKDMFRDKRVYDIMSGKDASQAPDNVDRYANLEERKFKQASSVEEGKKIYEENIQPKMQNLKGVERKDKMQSIRKNSSQVAPTDWQQSEEYYAYIKRTQGVDAMNELRKEKERQDNVNRQKSWLVH